MNQDLHSNFNKLNENNKAQIPVTYCNITSSFSGIGHILLDVNSVILTAVKKYSLDLKTCPNQMIFLHFNYLIQNLKKYQLKDILYFYEFTGDKYFDLALSILNDSSFCSFSQIRDSLENKRISLALTCSERSELIDFLSSSGLYIGFVDYVIFEIPFAFTLISKPRNDVLQENSYEVKFEYGNVQSAIEERQIQEFNRKFFDFESDSNYKEQIEESLVSSILNHNLSNSKRIFFDGSNKNDNSCKFSDENISLNTSYDNGDVSFTKSDNNEDVSVINRKSQDNEDISNVKSYDNKHISTVKSDQYEDISNIKSDNNKHVSDVKSDNSKHTSIDKLNSQINRSLFNKSQTIPWSGKDLDLIMASKLEKTSQKHLANIRRSAMSLYDGKFHYNTIVKETSEAPKKMSAKMKAIVEENALRIKKEKEKMDNQWLRNFFANYSKLSNIKARRSYIENIKINSEYINRKLLLLKIELYSEIWNLEKKKDIPDEKVLVPLYLSCLSYIDQFVTNINFENVNIEKGKSSKSNGSRTELIYDESELEFVMTKLIEANFEATVREILQKLKIELNLPFVTDGNGAPNDIDIYFQLKYAGDHLKRTLGTRKDKRVPFDPDKWQVDLLDAVDAGKSAIVAAPTSSGKTFICFYAIEKILRSNDTDAVVFCLPTKALVNQVSADIYARFNPKNVKTQLQGTLMPDISNDPFNCQVLITLPSMLESLLNSRDCSQIKYIIIDEVHKINDSQLGLKLERIIHLAHCPLLLLSATLGNLQGFYNWFKGIENAKGRECELVYHGERYCELKSFVYSSCPSKDVESKDEDNEEIVNENRLVPINSMFAYSFAHLATFGFSNDLHFLPEELLNIYYYIYMILDQSQKKLIKNLAPKKFFKSNIICKADIKEYQHYLLNTFESWVKQGILNEDQVLQIHTLLTKESHEAFNFPTNEKYIAENILQLLNTLKDSNMLPVIVFNTDRDFVTKLAKFVYQELEDRDFAKKKDKAMEKIKKEMKRTRDVEKTKDSWIEDSIASEQFVEPEQRDIKFTFLDPVTKLTDYEVKEEFSDIRSGAVEKDILDMAYRGIGIHHSAMNRKYRSAIEILFRKKHVRVLFATETLALGINMPCRTVVFAGDSLELDPMNYKQMSGRAGRRGYDTLGNIVFFGIPKPRVQNLMVSMLPEIQGSYTYSNTSLVSFNIENSLLSRPLLVANNGKDEIIEKIENLNLNENTKVTATLDILDSYEGRKSLVEYQKANYPFIYPSSYLWDLFISNRDLDPSIFLFAILFENDKIIWTPNDFMNLVAHLFEVRPVHDLFPHVLEPLPGSIQQAIDQINDIYIHDVSKFYPKSLKKLQKLSSEPLFHVRSFIYTLKQKKNSYIYDFFQHGSPVKIRKNNEIIEGELWQSLNSLDIFFKSLLSLIETNFTSEDARFKKLRLIYETFHTKFTSIFA